MLKIYLLRHGETDYNLNGIVQGGGVDSDLNTTGIRQSLAFHKRYEKVPFEGVACSGLKRTYQTISPFFEAYPDVVRIPELNEMDWGVMEGKKGTPEMHKEYKRLNNAWAEGKLDEAIEGGESPRQAWERLREGIEQVRNTYRSGNVLVCSHGRVLRIMLAELLGYGMQNMNLFSHNNTGLNLLTISPKGQIRAELLNDLSHLK